jgi:Arc/MetJ-type ribon-helix-helix transcriptional regulator
MSAKEITLTLSESLYSKTQQLVDEGLFDNIEEAIRAGLRHVLLEAALIEGGAKPAHDYAEHLAKLRHKITEAGGLFSGQTPERIIETLRQTRDQVYEEKYAAHFRHQ